MCSSSCYFPDNLRGKEFPRVFRRYLMYGSVYGYRHTGIPALLLAETGFKVDFIMKGFFFNKLLKGLDNIKRAFYMAGTADAHTKFKHWFSPFWYS
jgi:hypothetical protein